MDAAQAVSPLRSGRRSPALEALKADRERYDELRRWVTETKASWGAIERDIRGDRLADTTCTLSNRDGCGRRRAAGADQDRRVADGRASGSRREISDTEMVKARLLRAIDRQIDKVDRRLRKRGAVVEEKHSRILGNLAKTLSALMQMGKAAPPRKKWSAPNSAEVEQQIGRTN